VSFAKEFSVLLCFAAACLHLFAGESAHSFGEAADATPATVIAVQQRQPFSQLFSSIHLLQLFDFIFLNPWSRVKVNRLFSEFCCDESAAQISL